MEKRLYKYYDHNKIGWFLKSENIRRRYYNISSFSV